MSFSVTVIYHKYGQTGTHCGKLQVLNSVRMKMWAYTQPYTSIPALNKRENTQVFRFKIRLCPNILQQASPSELGVFPARQTDNISQSTGITSRPTQYLNIH